VIRPDTIRSDASVSCSKERRGTSVALAAWSNKTPHREGASQRASICSHTYKLCHKCRKKSDIDYDCSASARCPRTPYNCIRLFSRDPDKSLPASTPSYGKRRSFCARTAPFPEAWFRVGPGSAGPLRPQDGQPLQAGWRHALRLCVPELRLFARVMPGPSTATLCVFLGVSCVSAVTTPAAFQCPTMCPP